MLWGETVRLFFGSFFSGKTEKLVTGCHSHGAPGLVGFGTKF